MSTQSVPPGKGKALERHERIAKSLRLLARVIGEELGKEQGFVLLAYDLGPLGEERRTNYIANCDRKDVLQLLREFIASMDEQTFNQDVPEGETPNEKAFERWWAGQKERATEQDLKHHCYDAWNARGSL